MTVQENKKLKPYLNPAGTWAFSIGTSIGWGSFVVTCSTYLSQAGIMGTILGLVLGMAVILIITKNLSFALYESGKHSSLITMKAARKG